MSIINQLASSLGRRDEAPNQALAKTVAENGDKKAVKELVENLNHKNKDIQNDCIKVLYEIGELKPELIANYINDFLAVLGHKNNRLQWGGMTALNYISKIKPKAVFENLPQIIEAAEQGSVITRDNAVNILINLAAVPKYASDAFDLLIDQLLNCSTNQLPMYAERALPIINEKNKAVFVETLNMRLDDIEKESKRRRVEKVIKKISK